GPPPSVVGDKRQEAQPMRQLVLIVFVTFAILVASCGNTEHATQTKTARSSVVILKPKPVYHGYRRSFAATMTPTLAAQPLCRAYRAIFSEWSQRADSLMASSAPALSDAFAASDYADGAPSQWEWMFENHP